MTTLAGLLRRRFARDVALLLGAEGVALAIAAVQGIFLARLLGPTNYGVVALVVAYPMAIQKVFDARSEEASIRFLGEFHTQRVAEKASAVVLVGYVVDLAVSLLAFAVVAATAWLAAPHLVHDASKAGLLLVYAGALIVASPTFTSRAILKTFGEFPTLAIERVCVAAAGAALVVSLVGWAGMGVEGAVLGMAGMQVLDGVVLLFLGARRAREAWGLSGPRAAWNALEGRRREFGGFLAWTNVIGLIGLIPSQLALLLVGAIAGTREAGYFRLAQSVTTPANVGLLTLRSVAYPRLAAIGAQSKPQLFVTARRYAVLIGAPLGAFAMLCILVVEPAVDVLVGSAYHGAVPAAQLMLAAGGLATAFFWMRPLYLSLGELKLAAQTSAAGTMVALVVSLALIPAFGAAGAAAALIVLAVVSYVLQLLALRRRYGVRLVGWRLRVA